MAMTFERMGRFEEAERFAKKGITLNPSFFQIRHQLYTVYVLAGNKETEIEAMIQEIESIGNKTRPIYDILMHYYKDRDPAKSESYYELAEELDKLTDNSSFQPRIILKVEFEKFIE